MVKRRSCMRLDDLSVKKGTNKPLEAASSLWFPRRHLTTSL